MLCLHLTTTEASIRRQLMAQNSSPKPVSQVSQNPTASGTFARSSRRSKKPHGWGGSRQATGLRNHEPASAAESL